MHKKKTCIHKKHSFIKKHLFTKHIHSFNIVGLLGLVFLRHQAHHHFPHHTTTTHTVIIKEAEEETRGCSPAVVRITQHQTTTSTTPIDSTQANISTTMSEAE